jgi:DNA-binding NarL/FixJ family response regulator
VKKITVLLVDDHPVVRSGLRALLSSAADLLVVGEAADGREAVRETLRLEPDVVLMDVAMPLLSGVEATRQISRAAPLVKILVLSTYSDSQHVQAALDAGASSYLMKSTAGETLLDLIRGSVRGRVGFSPEILNHLSDAWARRSADNTPPETPDQSLSCRESEILQLVAEGFRTKQIGTMIGISYKTVEKHRQSLMTKLGIHRVCGLTRYAVRAGIIESNKSPLSGRAVRGTRGLL